MGRVIRWIWRIHCVILLALILIFAYGTPSDDAERVQRFIDASRTWMVNPEFRDVQVQYVRLGSAATSARVAGVSAGQFMMGMRRVPYLPPSLAANEGSQHHYDEFAAGELRAYFRLSEEQGTKWVLEEMARISAGGPPSDEQLRQFLGGFHTDEPLAVDEGAVGSVRKVFDDIGPGVPRDGEIVGRLRAMAGALAASRGLPAEVERLTPAEQQELFGDLDAFVRGQDRELWRIKQVNDFLNGVWAQTFGQTYARWSAPILVLWRIARVVGPLWVAIWAVLLAGRVRRGWRAGRRGGGEKQQGAVG